MNPLQVGSNQLKDLQRVSNYFNLIIKQFQMGDKSSLLSNLNRASQNAMKKYSFKFNAQRQLIFIIIHIKGD